MIQVNVNSNVIMIYPVKVQFMSMTHPDAQNVVQIGFLIFWLVIVDHVHAIIHRVLLLNGINVLLVPMVMNLSILNAERFAEMWIHALFNQI